MCSAFSTRRKHQALLAGYRASRPARPIAVQSQQITGRGLETEVFMPRLLVENHMSHDLENTLALLARTPAALDSLLRNLPEIWTHRDEGENTWTVAGVVAHLVDADTVNWIPRAKHILEFADTRPFEPFNRVGGEARTRDKSLPELLDEFIRLRAKNIAELRTWNLQPSDLERRGLHPALGAVMLSQLLAAWAAHDLTHLHQITRIMAGQYRAAVGPWSKFLGVLQCAGHSAPA